MPAAGRSAIRGPRISGSAGAPPRRADPTARATRAAPIAWRPNRSTPIRSSAGSSAARPREGAMPTPSELRDAACAVQLPALAEPAERALVHRLSTLAEDEVLHLILTTAAPA